MMVPAQLPLTCMLLTIVMVTSKSQLSAASTSYCTSSLYSSQSISNSAEEPAKSGAVLSVTVMVCSKVLEALALLQSSVAMAVNVRVKV